MNNEIEKMLEELFGKESMFGLKGLKPQGTGHTQKLKNDYMALYDRVFLESIMTMYLQGMAICDIEGFTGVGSEEINTILDRYAPFLGD